MISNKKYLLGASLALLLVVGCGLEGLIPVLCGQTPCLNGNNLKLMRIAEVMVRPGYPKALLVEVLGAPAEGSTAEGACDVVRWQFRFTEDPNTAGAGTVFVDYNNGQFVGPTYTSQGLIGTEFAPLPRIINLERAILLMRNAGHAAAFSSVAFRKPLTFPPPTEAIYAFSLPDKLVIVGAVTGNVTTE